MAVEFEEQSVPVSMKMPVERSGAVTKFFLSIGLAKNVRDAQIIMTVVAVLMIAIAAYIVFTSSAFRSAAPSLTPQQLQQVLDEGAIRH
jgi:hypothetical protein